MKKMPIDYREFRNRKTFLLWIDRTLAHGLFRQAMLLLLLMLGIFLLSITLFSLSGGDWKTFCSDKHLNRWALPFYLLIVPDAFYDFCTYYNEAKRFSVGTLSVFFACITYILGVLLFTGMIISVLTNVIERRVADYRHGHTRYLKSGHYVIMGYDSMLPSFIHAIFEKDPQAYVLVLTAANVVAVKEKLRKAFRKDQMERIIVNYGHRTDKESYPSIHLESAEEIFIVGWRGHPAHDAINVECVDNICSYLKKFKKDKKQQDSRNMTKEGENGQGTKPKDEEKQKGPKSITCVFNDLDTWAAFKRTEIFGDVNRLNMDFYPYNFYAEWAKQVLVDRYYVDMGEKETKMRYVYPAVYGNGIAPGDSRYVHLVFVGATPIAEAFGVEAAQILHFPNFNHNRKLKTRITYIDLDADKWMPEFITRNRNFFDLQPCRYVDMTATAGAQSDKGGNPAADAGDSFLDIEFEIIKGDAFSVEVQNLLRDWAKEKDKQYLSIFLTRDKQDSNFILGMNMPDEVYENEIPLFIRQDLSDNFVTNLRKAAKETEFEYRTFTPEGKVNTVKKKGRYAHIYPFGMNEIAYESTSLNRAKLINYIYVVKQNYGGFPSESVLEYINNLWGDADKSWKTLSSANKWSNLYNAYMLTIKMDTLKAMRGLDLSDNSKNTDELSETEVEELAMVEHNRWDVEELLMGFRPPRPEEDYYEALKVLDKETAKTFQNNKKLFIHHCIRPYDQLDDNKENDRAFSRYIPWIYKMTKVKK